MARQRVGEKKITQYRQETSLHICTALVRGGTDHRVDLFLKGGRIVRWWPKTGEMYDELDYTWNYHKYANNCQQTCCKAALSPLNRRIIEWKEHESS